MLKGEGGGKGPHGWWCWALVAVCEGWCGLAFIGGGVGPSSLFMPGGTGHSLSFACGGLGHSFTMCGAGCSLSFVGGAAGCLSFFMGGVAGHLLFFMVGVAGRSLFFIGGGAGPSLPFMAGGAGPSLLFVAPHLPFRVLGTCRFSWVEVPSFEGEGGGLSFVCAGTCCHSSVLVFCVVHLLSSFIICWLSSVCHCQLFVIHCFMSVLSGVVSCHVMATDMVAGLPIGEG